ncbi:hypothetical protein FZC84_18870 [Rossellomorea vietnamensis]|uniref:Uncharacterized protein n=1 Tax=Rossellomorea vietnamensis TaxID=218284 RepID=A0A5D4M7D7_9BACI|nr:hypothetical protein FZC84_18870 [Rossellomorea vietnamensis]
MQRILFLDSELKSFRRCYPDTYVIFTDKEWDSSQETINLLKNRKRRKTCRFLRKDLYFSTPAATSSQR